MSGVSGDRAVGDPSDANLDVAGEPPPGVGGERRRRIRVVVRADLPAALGIAALVALTGLPLGLLWAWLAPRQVVLVLADDTTEAVAGQSEHRFDDLALFLLLGLAAGVLAGAAVWLLRERRGPVALLAVVAGAAAAGWLGLRTGVGFAPAAAAVPPGQLTAASPELDSGWAVIAPPLGAVLAYVLAAAWNGREDLGRRLA